MKYYQEITLIDSLEIPFFTLWSKTYTQLHLALVEQAKVVSGEKAITSNIGVCFPEYRCFEKNDKTISTLGSKVRVFAQTKQELEQLNITQWLSRLMDYVHIKPIKPVPEKVTYVGFVREQVKGEAGIEKKMQAKAEHWSKKSGLPIEHCLLSLEKSKPTAKSDSPFIWLESQETKRLNSVKNSRFPLFIKKVELKQAQVGHVNCYGLNVNHKEVGQLVSVPQF